MYPTVNFIVDPGYFARMAGEPANKDLVGGCFCSQILTEVHQQDWTAMEAPRGELTATRRARHFRRLRLVHRSPRQPMRTRYSRTLSTVSQAESIRLCLGSLTANPSLMSSEAVQIDVNAPRGNQSRTPSTIWLPDCVGSVWVSVPLQKKRDVQPGSSQVTGPSPPILLYPHFR